MKNKQSGVALIEFALVLPLLLILTFITTELGRALYQYNTLTKSVRDAARYLSVQIPSTKITESKNLVVYGSLSVTGQPLASGLTIGQVKDPVWALRGSNPVIRTVTVEIAGCAKVDPLAPPVPCYKFVSLVDGVFGVKLGIINYADISATMRAPL